MLYKSASATGTYIHMSLISIHPTYLWQFTKTNLQFYISLLSYHPIMMLIKLSAILNSLLYVKQRYLKTMKIVILMN
jgi:hypothetical protein